MSSAGPNGPGSFANKNSVGTIGWATTTNAAVADGFYTTAALNAGQSSFYLALASFGFSVPSGATIDGILVEALCQNTSAGNIQDNSVRLYASPNPIADDKAVASDWPTYGMAAYRSWGGPTDLWGFTFDDTAINSSAFGCVISAINNGAFPQTAYIDYVRITVYYSTSGNQVQTQTQVIQPPRRAYEQFLRPDG